MVPTMTRMPLTVECYGFWENYFKIIEVAFSQQNFNLPYLTVEKREEVNYNFWQKKKKQFILRRQANKLINTKTNFIYQFTIPLSLLLLIPLLLLHPHQGTYVLSRFAIILKSSTPPIKT